MADNNLIVEFEAVWQKGDLVVPCAYCDDLIVSGSNTLCMKVITPKSATVTETDFIVCNPCFQVLTNVQE